VCPPPFCLSVKSNSGDYMAEGGLTTDEALEQVRWLLECGIVDFVEISSGIAEQSTSKLHSESERIVGPESLGTDFGCRFI
jgi:2,4-dienoyl-CoA reductase-like NADH-dependent reductase (Old Yellow Enzyme family)